MNAVMRTLFYVGQRSKYQDIVFLKGQYEDIPFLEWVPHGHLLLDSAPNNGPLISCLELDKFQNCWNKGFRTSKILTILYQQFCKLLNSQRDMSSPRLGALSNNRWSGGIIETLNGNNWWKMWVPIKLISVLNSRQRREIFFFNFVSPILER